MDSPGGASAAVLQRLVGGAWRTEATGYVRSSGRYTLVAKPPTRGNQRYRVLIEGGSAYALSPVVLLGAY